MLKTLSALSKKQNQSRISQHLQDFKSLPEVAKSRVRKAVMEHPDWGISYQTFDNYLKKSATEAFDSRLRIELDKYLKPTF
jgi:hypothetical protein